MVRVLRRGLVGVAAGIASVLCACATDDSVSRMDGELGPPFASVADAVTHGDFAAVFRVVGEHEFSSADATPQGDGLPATTPPEVIENGYQARVVEVTVETVVWDSGRVAIPEAFEFVSDGWQVDGEDRRPVTGPSGVRLVVEGHYFAMFKAQVELGPLNPMAVFELDGSRLLRRGNDDGGGAVPPEFENAELAEVGMLLAEASPHRICTANAVENFCAPLDVTD